MKNLDEAKESRMVKVCEICHWPYVETDQEALDARCVDCPVEKAVEAQLKKLV